MKAKMHARARTMLAWLLFLATFCCCAGGLAVTLDLDDYRYLHSTRGELLRRLGRTDEALDAYRRAFALVHDDAERRLLERRLAGLERPPRPDY